MSSSAVTTITPPPAPPPPAAAARRRRRVTPATIGIVAITALAAWLRLNHLGSVPNDPFYDAAVRSMGLSWHNFFFGAFEPDGSVSIDKPPVDLWLQVLSVKALGFSSFSLKLPEALAGTLSVPLLYVTVRRLFGAVAGLSAALALAVMPIEVITSRSDTMDGLMMLLIVVALWACVRAIDGGATRWLLLGAAALGVAFNVKLLESVVPLPGLAVLVLIGLPGSWRRRALQLLAAAAVYVVVALLWLSATLLYPAHDRPFAIGSSNGSAWNAAFVFNGSQRISGTNAQGTSAITYGSTSGYPTATQAERDHIPITAPSPTRLLTKVGPLSGERLGLELLAGLLLGLPALLAALLARPPDGPDASDAEAARRRRLRRATAAGLLVWLGVGIVLFSAQARLHPRYVEAFTPAVAAALGIGVAWATEGLRPRRLAWMGAALALLAVYGERLVYGTIGAWWVMVLAAALAVGLGVLARLAPERARAGLTVATVALLLVAVLSIPFKAALAGVRANTSDAGHVGALRPDELAPISAFLRANQGGAHYEVAAASATSVGALIVKDARPVLILTTYNARTLTPVAQLQRLVAAGAVRYALLNTVCGRHTAATDAGCSAPARWVRAHGVDVSTQAALPKRGILWQLSSR
jgi:4-amino-4-deoxy-L-arabinose transferase-like glycosyltransferase